MSGEGIPPPRNSRALPPPEGGKSVSRPSEEVETTIEYSSPSSRRLEGKVIDAQFDEAEEEHSARPGRTDRDRAEAFFDSIAWVASFENPHEYLVGIKNGMSYLLNRETYKRPSIGYDSFKKIDKKTLIGTRGGKEYVVNQSTGKEESFAFDRIQKDRLGKTSGTRFDLGTKGPLDGKKKDKKKGGGH